MLFRGVGVVFFMLFCFRLVFCFVSFCVGVIVLYFLFFIVGRRAVCVRMCVVCGVYVVCKRVCVVYVYVCVFLGRRRGCCLRFR